jgi:hypothetical protein
MPSYPPASWLHRLASRDELRLMLALLALLTALLVLGELLPRLADGGVLIVWVALWLPLLGLLFWRRRLGRRAWLRVHLNRESPWSDRLRGGGLMLLGQSVAAAALALALLLSLARGIGPSTWIVLVLFVPLWAKSWGGLGRYLARHASTEFLPLTTARILVRTWGVVLLLGFGTWGLWQPLPDLGETTLLAAVRHYASGHGVESPLLEHALTAIAVLDGARHWLAQHWLEGVPGVAV